MKPSNPKTKARKVVSGRLRSFFAQLNAHLATSTGKFLERVEANLNGKKGQG